MDNLIRFTADGGYVNRGRPVGGRRSQFRYLIPATDDNGEFVVVDCWPANREGAVHPGYGCSPVPTPVEQIGGMVRHLSGEGD